MSVPRTEEPRNETHSAANSDANNDARDKARNEARGETCGELPRTQPRLRIESLQVKADRVRAEVRMADALRVRTTPKLAQRVLRDFPNLARHACVNGEGPAFGAVIDHTALPHLLEHLVIDLQVKACADPERTFTGATRWVDREQGLAQVEVSYADDIAALRAFRDAAAYLNGLQ